MVPTLTPSQHFSHGEHSISWAAARKSRKAFDKRRLRSSARSIAKSPSGVSNTTMQGGAPTPFCTAPETACPECGWKVPLAPSWVIGEKTLTVAQLTPIAADKRFSIEIRSRVGEQTLEAARDAGTVQESRLKCPNPDCRESTSIAAVRGDRRGSDSRKSGLRLWRNEDLVPHPDDVLQERLYCVRWRLPRLDELLWTEQRMRTTQGPAPPSDVGSASSASHGHPNPIPDWVDLDRAIESLTELLSADDRKQLAKLRKRDWFAEEHALQRARRHLEKLKGTKPPPKSIDAATQRLRRHSDSVTHRTTKVKSLTSAIPSPLYKTVDDGDLRPRRTCTCPCSGTI